MTSRRLGVLGLLVLAVLALVLGAVLLSQPDQSPSRAPAARPVAAPVDLPALRVLRDWDDRRSAAYAAGSPRLLRGLYVAGSRAGEADLRLLSRYRARGWRVTGMRMQVVEVRVLERRSHRLRLEVVDRLSGAVAVRRGQRVALPRDGASARVITLVRGDDAVWRVREVAPVSPRGRGRTPVGP